MRTRWPVVWLVVALVVVATASPRAFAQPASVQAQSLFEEGRKLLQAGKLAEACAAFESSQKLDPAVTTLLNLADCRERNHQLATAWGTFSDANRLARTGNNAKLAGVASSHARKLEPRLSKLTISVPADRQVAGLEVLRGDEPVNPASWNHALPVDGGTYTITARAPGRAPWSITKTIKIEGDAQTIEIPALTAAKPAAPPAVAGAGTRPAAPPAAAGVATRPAAPPAVADPRPAAPPAAAVRTGSPPDVVPAAPPTRPVAPPAKPVTVANNGDQVDAALPWPTPAVSDQPEAPPSRMLPLAVGAGALVLGGAAFGFHLSGNSTYDKAKAATTQDRRDDLESSANTRRYVAEALGVAAIGCAGVAVYLFVRSRGEHRAETAAMVPVASPQLTGLAVVGRW
jgi:hypothetical protein